MSDFKDWIFNSYIDPDDVEIPDKIGDQAKGRGWTEEEIRDTIGKGATGTSSDSTGGKVENPDPASVFGNEEGYIVVNNETNEVVQVSDRNDPNWKVDVRIEWNE